MQISHYLEGISLQRSNSLYCDVCFRGKKHTLKMYSVAGKESSGEKCFRVLVEAMRGKDFVKKLDSLMVLLQ